MSRLTVAMPKARDGRDRAPTIPSSVLAKRAAAAAAASGGAESGMDVEGSEGGMAAPRKTEKDLMWENGGPGVYSCDYRKYYDLKVRVPEKRLWLGFGLWRALPLFCLLADTIYLKGPLAPFPLTFPQEHRFHVRVCQVRLLLLVLRRSCRCLWSFLYSRH